MQTKMQLFAELLHPYVLHTHLSNALLHNANINNKFQKCKQKCNKKSHNLSIVGLLPNFNLTSVSLVDRGLGE